MLICKSPSVAIVVTTIYEPKFLDGYVANLQRFGRENVEIIVIIDRKTPASVAERCAHYGLLCPTLDEQETFLARFPALAPRIPYDSDNRRNIGFLMALDRGAELLISIDDDNYCLDDVDFVGEHLAAGKTIDTAKRRATTAGSTSARYSIRRRRTTSSRAAFRTSRGGNREPSATKCPRRRRLRSMSACG